MLKNTFHHVPGIGTKTEELLWYIGIVHWDKFRPPYPSLLSYKQIETIKHYLDVSQKQIEKKNAHYFARLLPANLLWRLFPEFKNDIVYLDIESNGLDNYYGTITTIALYDGKSISYYIQGENLNDFEEDIQKYKVIISYNGKCFDIPFLENNLGVRLNHTHIDLRYVLGSLGYKGGLKGCEIALGIDRGELKGLDGYFAVLLWDDYQKNHNKKALETLLAYNIEDVVNLEALMVLAYNEKLKNTPFYESHRLSIPSMQDLPFKADRETVERIKHDSMLETDIWID